MNDIRTRPWDHEASEEKALSEGREHFSSHAESMDDEDKAWRQFTEFELSKIQAEAADKSGSLAVVPETLQFAFRHAASYLIARLRKTREEEGPDGGPTNERMPDSRPPLSDGTAEIGEAEAEGNVSLTHPEMETMAAPPVFPVTEKAGETPNSESAMDEEERWRHFIQDELGKIQPREAAPSPIRAVAPELIKFALRHLSSYLLARLKKERNSEGSSEEEMNNSRQEQTDEGAASRLKTAAKRSSGHLPKGEKEKKDVRLPARREIGWKHRPSASDGKKERRPSASDSKKRRTAKTDLKTKRRSKVELRRPEKKNMKRISMRPKKRKTSAGKPLIQKPAKKIRVKIASK